MKVALCFAVWLLLVVGLEAATSSSILPTIKKENLHRPRQTEQECDELEDYLYIEGSPIPSVVDQSCKNALLGAGDDDDERIDIACSSVCQSGYDAAVECFEKVETDAKYKEYCGPGGFAGTANRAGSTTVYISLLVIGVFLAVFATVF